jgi:6-bladed beta-propeller
MHKTTIPIVILFLLSAACQPRAFEQEGFVTLEVFKMPKTDLKFESVRFVPLSSGDDHPVGNQLLIKLYEDEIFILDIGSPKCILRFDKSGNFLNKIGSAGRGAEEFVGAKDFVNHGDTISILSTPGNESKIISYLKEGGFVRSLPIALAGKSFEKTPSGFIINTGINPVFHSYRFYTTNHNGIIQDSLLKNDTKLEFGMSEENFSIHLSDVYIHEALFNTLYTFRSGRLEQTYLIDMSEYNIPQDFYTKNAFEGLQMIDKQGFGSICNYFENKRFSVFEVLTQKSGSDVKAYQFAYDKKREELFQHSFIGNETNGEIFQHLIGLTDQNEMVYLIHPIEVIDKIETLKNYETSKESNLEGINEMDNPIITFCKLSL